MCALEGVHPGLSLGLAVGFGKRVLEEDAARGRGEMIHCGLGSRFSGQSNLLGKCDGLVIEYERLVVRLAQPVEIGAVLR